MSLLPSHSLIGRLPAAVSRLRPLQVGIRSTSSASTVAESHNELRTKHDLPPPSSTISRLSHLQREDPKPFSHFLTDTFRRQHNYLRISVTERCNLRCTYCMPALGVPLSPPSHLLTSPEIIYLCSLFVSEGVNKIRLTGGEPTVRSDILPLMRSIGSLKSRGLKELCITSNGLALRTKLDAMLEAGLTGVNLSLDTLDPTRFEMLTRRRGWEKIWRCFERLVEVNRLGAGIKVKLNTVVMRGINESEMLDFVELGRERDVEVRFIEYMPFQGNKWERGKVVSYREMLERVRARYPGFYQERGREGETSKTWQVPGFRGKVGFITSMTENFCAGCNRLRITSDGNLKVCLFGNAEVSLRDLLRRANTGEPIEEEAMEAVKRVEMERAPGLRNAEEVSGRSERERELLEVIEAAVKRKKARHAGMGELENMENRPMILIDDRPLRQQTPRSPPSTRPHTTTTILTNSAVPTHHYYRHHHLLHPPRPPLHHLYSLSTSSQPPPTHLPHLHPTTSQAHQISVSHKPTTHRTALAAGHITFSNATPRALIRSHALQKGDVLAVARVAGIMAAKHASALIPLAHAGVALEGCAVDVDVVGPRGQGPSAEAGATEGEVSEEEEEEGEKGLGRFGGIRIAVRAESTGKTGVEMEALAGVVGAGLTVVDMCKAVDKACVLGGVRVLGKTGGRSGAWGVFSSPSPSLLSSSSTKEAREDD
ncbi:MAG: hypothetical protein LQ342_003750 [Letrouitia transgressa]|nr:MAG: hypothetical protein LQ342_003750 [Letrouitia transgressa]